MKDYRCLRKKVNLAFAAGDAVSSGQVMVEGELKTAHVRLPNFANSGASGGVFSLEDVDAYQIYVSDSLAENANHNLTGLDRVLTGLTTLKLTLPASAGSAASAVAVLGVWGRDEGA